MHNRILALFCPVFVLISGLVSCSPDKKTTVDVYNPAPPQIHTANGSLSAKEWDGQVSKHLDLQDAFDFSDAHPSSFLIKSQCRLGEKNYYGIFPFSNTLTASVFQIVPDEILLSDLTWIKAECSFEMNLVNGSGSNHIFNLAAIPVRDNHLAEVRVAHEPATGEPANPLHLSFQQMQDVRVRFDNSNAAAAEIICQDATVASLPFSSVVDLGSFDFKLVQLRKDRQADVLRTSPEQNCRARILENGKPSGISNIFQVLFPLKELTAELTNTFTLSNSYTRDTVALFDGKEFVLAEWRITNPENVKRYFRIPHKAPTLTVNVFTVDHQKMVYTVPWLHLEAENASNKNLGMSLDPLSSVTIRLTFQAPGQMHCPPKLQPDSVILENFEPLILEEVSASAKSMAQLELNLPTMFYFANPGLVQTIAQYPMIPTYQNCGWP